jgi:lipopolysaccharide export system protein LptA
MRYLRCRAFFLYAMVLAGLILPEPARAEAPRGSREPAEPGPIVIKSDTLEVNNEQKVVTFSGGVHAQKDDFVITCEKMLVYYQNLPGKEDTGAGEPTIDKIVAMGSVAVHRAQGGVATAEKAVYGQKEEKIVLTGNPMVRQGNDFVEGDRVTIYLKENRSVVEGSQNKKVKATVFPPGKKR